MRGILILAIGLLLATPAGAQWYKDPACTGDQRSAVTFAVRRIFFCPTAIEDSPRFTLGQEGTVCFDPDTGGTGTATAIAWLRKCSGNATNANECERVIVDNNFDGVLDNEGMNGDNGATSGEQRACIYDVPAGAYYIEVSTGPGGGEDPRVSVEVK